jgi:hypothetical protein
VKLAEEWSDTADVETEVTSPPMELPEILENIRGFFSCYIVFSNDAQATAVTLWVAHTWVSEAFDYTPYLHISSPVKRCGKSRVFDCLRLLCVQPWPVVSPTEAVLFRKIEQETPTVLFDEVDAVFNTKKGDDGKEAMTFSRILDRSQLEFPTVRSSRFVVGFLCLSSLANAAGGKFANELCGRWTL